MHQSFRFDLFTFPQGTSKSQLLAYVHKLSPRGIYTSGKGSSAVGLTASVVRDPETRDLVLESGQWKSVVVFCLFWSLSIRSACTFGQWYLLHWWIRQNGWYHEVFSCLWWEFHHFITSFRAILHEAMEQQTVSVTKAGIIATLNARTSILASANPGHQKY